MLDNPVWHALAGPHRSVAQWHGVAARYDPDVAPFCALPDGAMRDAWDDLREVVGAGGVAFLFGRPSVVPDSWELFFAVAALQMVATAVVPSPFPDAVALGPDDVDDVLALVARTEPGPFARRTIELGDYIGVRDADGALVAMAGQRMHPPGYREISAVCTDAHVRGRGLASALVRDQVDRIDEAGETAILHVVDTNTTAIRVYETLGFTVRRAAEVVGLRAPT